MRSIPEAAFVVVRRDPAELADMIHALDPFQDMGIPCWSAVAGPLDDPYKRSWYDTVTAFDDEEPADMWTNDMKASPVCRYCQRGHDVCSCD